MAASELIAVLKLRDDMTKQLRKVGGAVRNVASGMRKAFGLVRRSVFNLRNALVVVAAGAAAKMAGEFEQSMSRIVGLVGVAADEVAGFSEQVKNLAVESGRGPRELAEAMFFITSAGLRGSEAIEALRVSAQAAAAGLGETKSVADAVTSAMNAYRDSNLGAAQATAILVATVREGKAAADSISQALGRVLPVSSKLGVSFDQVGASIAAMTRLGLDANEASTALRSILTALLKPSKQGEEALKKVGLSFQGLREQLKEKGLLATLTTLNDKLGGNEEALAAVVPNVRGLTGVLNLVGNEGSETRDIFESLAATTEKDLADAFDVAKGTAAVAFGQMRAAMDNLIIAVGDFINLVGKSGVFQFLRDTFVELSESLNLTDESFGDVTEIADIFISALKGVGFAVAGTIDVVRKLLVPINFLRKAWLQMNSVLIQNKIETLEAKLEADAFNESLIAQRNEMSKQVREIGLQIVALDAASKAVLEERTAVEKWGTIMVDVTLKLKKHREEQTLLAKVAKENAALFQGLVPLSAEVAGSFSDLNRQMNELRAGIKKLTVAEQEFIFEGGSAEEMVRRFQAAMAELKVEKVATEFDIFKDSVRAASAELALGITDASDFADALQDLPEASRDFILAADSIQQMNDRLKQTRSQLDETKKRAEATAAGIKVFAGAVADFVGQVLDKAFAGQIRTMKDVGEIAQNVLQSLLKSVIQSLVQLAVQAAITRAIAGAAGGAVIQGGVAGAVGGGGIPSFKHGGVIRGPGLFIAGEEGDEAIVPLVDGNIPVKDMDGDGGRRGGGITNIFNVSAIDEDGVNRFFARSEVQDATKGTVVAGVRDDSRFRTDMNGSMG